ncbi:MAG: ATP-binding protein [Holophagales bacterium]|nr:ATP-binding protein [Holophagales bacterium]
MAVGVSVAMAIGVTVGVVLTVGVAFSVTYSRAPLFLFCEVPLQVFLFLKHRLTGAQNLDTSPVLWHDLSFFPLPFLGRHIESTAETNPILARRALEACAIAPGQKKVGQKVLGLLQAKELGQIARDDRFRAFLKAETRWLPGNASREPLLESFRQVACRLVSAEGSSFPHHRIEHLKRAGKDLDRLEVRMLGESSSLAVALRSALPSWKVAIDTRREAAEREASGLLPVPFRAGEPLSPERGHDVFRGRETSIRAIEQHLALADDARSVLLLGPRRTGKTSLLRMLPTFLPDAVCVFFDLQGHPVDTPAAFFRRLGEEVERQARRTRQLKLPVPGDGPPFEAAGDWLQALEDQLGHRRLLICIDELETLEHSFGGSRDDLLRLMGLIRSTIQHRRRVRLLVAGEAPFDELDGMWDAHFVSVREVRLGHLEPESARELVRRPIPDFPDGAIPEAVADRLVQRTGSQPFLVQLYAQILVSSLNDAGRKQAELADLEAVEEEVLTQVGSYFRDIWNRAPEASRHLLEALSRAQDPDAVGGKKARRWLERRGLIDAEGHLTIPVFGRFLLEEVLD